MRTINFKRITVIALKAVTSASIILIALFAMAVVGVKLIGLDVYIVQSPSMEPTCPVGSVIWVKKISDPSKLEVNDVVTFKLTKRTTATHRIIRIEKSDTDPAGYVFITKGDNNDSEDNVPLSPSDVIGKEILTIPYLGYVSNYVQTKPGVYVAITACIVVIGLLFVIDVLADDKTEKKSRKEKE